MILAAIVVAGGLFVLFLLPATPSDFYLTVITYHTIPVSSGPAPDTTVRTYRPLPESHHPPLASTAPPRGSNVLVKGDLPANLQILKDRGACDIIAVELTNKDSAPFGCQITTTVLSGASPGFRWYAAARVGHGFDGRFGLPLSRGTRVWQTRLVAHALNIRERSENKLFRTKWYSLFRPILQLLPAQGREVGVFESDPIEVTDSTNGLPRTYRLHRVPEPNQ